MLHPLIIQLYKHEGTGRVKYGVDDRQLCTRTSRLQNILSTRKIIDGFKFGGVLVKPPIRQIEFLANISGYAVAMIGLCLFAKVA